MVIVYLLLSTLTYVHFKMENSMKRMLDQEVTVLIILGAALKNNQIGPTLKARLKKGAELLQENPNLIVIVSGGKGNALKKSEGQLMKECLIIEFGIEANRILVEDDSENTYENLTNSKLLVPDGKKAIITSEFHTIRASFLANRVEMDAQILGVRTPRNKRFKLEMREYLAIIKSFFFDSY